MLSEGIAHWAYVNNIDTTYDQWKVTLHMTKEEAKKLKAVGISVKTDVDDEDKVTYSYTFTRKLHKRGKASGTNEQPRCVDSEKNKFDGMIGHGSKVRVLHKPYPWDYKGKKGIGTDFQAIQIIELVEYIPPEPDNSLDDGVDDFTAVKDGFVSTPSTKETTTEEDDIPF